MKMSADVSWSKPSSDPAERGGMKAPVEGGGARMVGPAWKVLADPGMKRAGGWQKGVFPSTEGTMGDCALTLA